MGHFSMGLLALATLFENRILSMIATAVVMANFSLPLALFGPLSAKEMAQKMKGTTEPMAILWVWVIKSYWIGNMFLFGTILHKFYNM
jgi:hypothetical protein